MKQDKKWLLREFRKLTFELQNGYAKVKAVDILPLIDQLDSPEKVVIPQFVADHIELCKSENKRLNVALSLSPENNMVFEMGVNWEEANEIYARAWLDGYEIEKEKLYYVLNKQGKTLLVFAGKKVSESGGYALRDGNKGLYQLTEKQIKDYDPRYWAFAVEVAE